MKTGEKIRLTIGSAILAIVSVADIVITWIALSEFFVKRLGEPSFGPGWLWIIAYGLINVFAIFLGTFIINGHI